MQKNVLQYLEGYSFGVFTALKVLSIEQARREITGERKLLDSEIDEIVAAAFGMNERWAGEIRKFYHTERNGEVPQKPQDFHFDPCRMKDICKNAGNRRDGTKVGFEISDEDLDEILRFSNFGESVSNILMEKVPVHTDVRKQVLECIDVMGTVIFKLNPDIDYWKIFFDYMPYFNDNTWNILTILPTMPEKYVDRLLETISSNRNILEMERREKKMAFLLEYEKKLEKLSKKNSSKQTQRKITYEYKQVFNALPVWALFYLYPQVNLVKHLATFPIRPKDVRYAYYFDTKLDSIFQDIIYDKICDDIENRMQKD